MLFLETVSDDIGQNRFAIIQGTTKDDQKRNQKISKSQWINQIFIHASGASISAHIMAGTRVGTANSLPWNTDFYIYIY